MIKEKINRALETDGVVILPPSDVFDTIALLQEENIHTDCTMLDPWYNKGFGGVLPDAGMRAGQEVVCAALVRRHAGRYRRVRRAHVAGYPLCAAQVGLRYPRGHGQGCKGKPRLAVHLLQ